MAFESLLGNDRLKQNLAESLAKKHISHFYLISGPAGSGKHTLAQLLEYVSTVDEAEIAFVDEAYTVNLALFEEGLSNPRTTFARTLLAMNGGAVISDDEKNTASLLCNAAIEARVIGLDKPAMSITGSGAHGIIATMPLYAVYRIRHLTKEQLRRATMLSYLVCTYIKEYSGKLSAFCGCAIAAGAGMACALCYLKGGGLREITYTLNNCCCSWLFFIYC